MAPKVSLLDDTRLVIGEGPHWDAEGQVLYYVDILDSTVLKYDSRSNKITRAVVDKKDKTTVTFILPIANTTDKFLIGYGSKVAVLTWDGVSSEPQNIEILDEEEDASHTGNRFNDAKVDPEGRVWLGTMGPLQGPDKVVKNSGALYSLTDNGKLVKHVTDIGISNGLTWSPDKKIFYYIDSIAGSIDSFDYDAKVGKIDNRKVVFDLKKNNVKGLPDGMTIDTEGKLWLATYNGNAIYRIDPITSEILQRVELPASQITSVTFGGSNLDELYVTSGSIDEPKGVPHVGRVFKITDLGVTGYPGVPAKLKLP
ncbi:regucalcin [Cephus cinctus]|uniref:Regucalcin n=1 Tax=Cephus cinctus TaxID=211228 RepID=A0AAJ7BI00_CEPCN|nr:regucalcin [Cephus cinctus]XP_015586129.1 regucalcin [Cephus cinctus]XP_015586139.1 regucalcin [Cephus cinctus]XP_015586151.1 regucalcin [Cephus cinctus]